MSINQFNISNYKKPLGGNESAHQHIGAILQHTLPITLHDLNVNELEIYTLNREKHEYVVGSEQDLVIFLNATSKGAGEDIILEAPVIIDGIQTELTRFLAPIGDGVAIVSGDETPVVLAEYRVDASAGYNYLNILFNVFKEDKEENFHIFNYIMKELNRLVFYPKTLENSWVHSQNKEALTKRFTAKFKQQKEAQLNDEKNQVQRLEDESEVYRIKLKQTFDKLFNHRRIVEAIMSESTDIGNAIIKDCDLIIANPKVKDLIIKDGKITVYTNELHIYADNGREYYGGEFRIELNPENSDIKFFGGVPHQGYWTNHDPHPHVNGDTGKGCLGNISATIAELSAQMQIYALTLTAIDYLESANTHDGAGKNVVRWEEIQSDGTRAVVETKRCHCCNDEFPIDTPFFTVFETIDEDDDDEMVPVGEHQVCETCRNDEYHLDEEYNVYIED